MKFAIAILVALCVLLLLKATRIGLKRVAKLYRDWNFRAGYYSVFQMLAWLVYIFWVMDYLFGEKFYYRYLVIALIFIVAGFIAWDLISDIIAGIIFRMKHDLEEGSRIRTGKFSGSVRSQHLTYMEVRTDEGMIYRVPYSRINQEVISEMTHAEGLEEHTIRLWIDHSIGKQEAESLIRLKVLNSPWSNLKEEPSIRLVEETDKGYVYDILLFSMNPRHKNYIEMALGKMPYAEVIRMSTQKENI